MSTHHIYTPKQAVFLNRLLETDTKSLYSVNGVLQSPTSPKTFSFEDDLWDNLIKEWDDWRKRKVGQIKVINLSIHQFHVMISVSPLSLPYHSSFRCWSGGVSLLTCGLLCGSCYVTLRMWLCGRSTQICWRARLSLSRWYSETWNVSSLNTSSFSTKLLPTRNHCLMCWRLDDWESLPVTKNVTVIHFRCIDNTVWLLLQAYSVLDREIGYCQGSVFIVGLLLTQVMNCFFNWNYNSAL